MIENVKKFHEKFNLPLGDADVLMSDLQAQNFRIKFIEEELEELKEALASNDKVKLFDALLDLDFVVKGAALFAGISPEQWNLGHDAVFTANMAKIRVAKESESKRGSSFDVVKPEGWQGPEEKLFEILFGRGE